MTSSFLLSILKYTHTNKNIHIYVRWNVKRTIKDSETSKKEFLRNIDITKLAITKLVIEYSFNWSLVQTSVN